MFISALLVAAALAAPPEVAPPALRMGDAAPALDISSWVKAPGGVSSITPGDGTIYVIDFWATWCAPCLAGFPALSELQERFADQGVVVVALSDEPPETVKAFLDLPIADTTHGARMRFAVATDPDASVRTGVLEAMWKYYIPQSLVIDRDGAIAWMGIPDQDGLAQALEQIVAGAYDMTEWREAYEARRALGLLFPKLLDEERWRDAAELAGDNWSRLNDIAARIALSAPGTIQDRDLDLADRLAAAAFDASGEAAPHSLHIRAAIAFERGEVRRAVALERQAYEMSLPGGDSLPTYQQALARYEAALAGG